MEQSEQQGILPREKLALLGADALSDAELLAVLLRTGTKGQPVLTLAQKILDCFRGNLRALCASSVGELAEMRGVGHVKALELTAAFALSRRLANLRFMDRPNMKTPKLVAEYMHDLLQESSQEELYVLLLDTRCRLLRSCRVSMGLIDRSLMHPREVFRPAIRDSSSSVILCHNHPGGSLTPSRSDLEATAKIEEAGRIIGIPLLDHIIVGERNQKDEIEYFSFRDNGFMSKNEKINVKHPGGGKGTTLKETPVLFGRENFQAHCHLLHADSGGWQMHCAFCG